MRMSILLKRLGFAKTTNWVSLFAAVAVLAAMFIFVAPVRAVAPEAADPNEAANVSALPPLITLAPNESTEIPIYGYCLHRSLAFPGAELKPIEILPENVRVAISYGVAKGYFESNRYATQLAVWNLLGQGEAQDARYDITDEIMRHAQQGYAPLDLAYDERSVLDALSDEAIAIDVKEFRNISSPAYLGRGTLVISNLTDEVQTMTVPYGIRFKDMTQENVQEVGIFPVEQGEDEPPAQPAASLGDTVWSDLNGDGIQDEDEPGVGGVMVNLWTDDDDDGQPDTQVGSTTTNAEGLYGFADLDPSQTYIVEFVAPDGYILTTADVGADDAADSDADAVTGLSAPINLSDGEHNPTIDAGIISSAASLGDKVWEDLNRDGIQDVTEPGVAGVTVNLWTDDDGDGQADTQVGSTMTNGDGMYGFSGLDSNQTYIVQFITRMDEP